MDINNLPISNCYAKREYYDFNCRNDSTPIFIHHGVFSEDINYKQILPKLTEALERKVFVIDARCRSRGNKKKFDISELVSDLISVIKRKGYSKVILIGHGIGGKVCSLVAQSFPELVEKLILTGINPIETYNAKIEYKTKKNTKGGLFKLDSFVENSVEEDNFKYLNIVVGDEFNYFPQKKIFDLTVDKKYLGETLLIYGGQSDVFTKQDCSLVRKVFVRCKFEFIKNAGSNLEIEFPSLFLEKVKSFLIHNKKTIKNEIIEKIRENRHISSHKIAEELNVLYSTVKNVLLETDYLKVSGVWILYSANKYNLLDRTYTYQNLLNRYKNDPFLKRIITGDKKWIYFKNKSIEKSFNQKDKSTQTVSKSVLKNNKVLLCVWWDYKGLIHSEVLNPGQELDDKLFFSQLERLRQEIKKKRFELYNKKNLIFHSPNNDLKNYYSLSEKLKDFNWENLYHPSNSPDLNPSDFHLFKPLQKYLDDKLMTSKKDCEFYVKKFFDDKTSEFFTKGISVLPTKWKNIIENDGNYCVKINSNV